MAWKIDTSHSQITFAIRHMMISTVRGEFKNFTGTLDFNEDEPAKSAVNVQIDAASINTNDPDRDRHLRSPDFLDVEKYPTITFESKRIEVVDERHGHIFGDLTIRGITHEVVLDSEYEGMAKSPWGTYSAGFNAETKISRQDFDLTWNQALETGGVLVGDELTIFINLEAIKEAVPEEEAERVPS